MTEGIEFKRNSIGATIAIMPVGWCGSGAAALVEAVQEIESIMLANASELERMGQEAQKAAIVIQQFSEAVMDHRIELLCQPETKTQRSLRILRENMFVPVKEHITRNFPIIEQTNNIRNQLPYKVRKD
jgi:hypothetical protein